MRFTTRQRHNDGSVCGISIQPTSFNAKSIARHRHALIVYGDIHLQRNNLAFDYVDHPKVRTIAGLLEHAQPGVRVFSIWTNTWTDLDTIQAGIGTWPNPSLAMLRGTTLGAADFTTFYPFDTNRFSMMDDGAMVPVPRSEWKQRSMEQQFDAILYGTQKP